MMETFLRGWRQRSNLNDVFGESPLQMIKVSSVKQAMESAKAHVQEAQQQICSQIQKYGQFFLFVFFIQPRAV